MNQSRELTYLLAEFHVLMAEFIRRDTPLDRRHEIADRCLAIRREAYTMGIEDFDVEAWGFQANTSALRAARQYYSDRLHLTSQRDRASRLIARIDTFLTELEGAHV